jgi:hypothetical protein
MLKFVKSHGNINKNPNVDHRGDTGKKQLEFYLGMTQALLM